jgi:hypothetical protein
MSRVVVHPTPPTLFNQHTIYSTVRGGSMRAFRVVSKRIVCRDDVSPSELAQLSHGVYEES